VSDDRTAEGLEHLQTAAREMIEAARAFLDVVDDFVGDDEKVASVAEAFGSIARGARRAAQDRSSTADPSGGDGHDADDDGFDGPVQHIKVS
jgi:hypothetical protein